MNALMQGLGCLGCLDASSDGDACDAAMHSSATAAQSPPAPARVVEAVMASAHPMGRVGEPDEVARAILFLSCEDSSFTSGTDLNVDGASAIRS